MGTIIKQTFLIIILATFYLSPPTLVAASSTSATLKEQQTENTTLELSKKIDELEALINPYQRLSILVDILAFFSTVLLAVIFGIAGFFSGKLMNSERKQEKSYLI